MLAYSLFDHQEGADCQGVDASAVEGADGGAGIGDEGLAEEIKGCVDEDGCGSGFAEFMEQAPEGGIGFFFDGVNANGAIYTGEPIGFPGNAIKKWRGRVPFTAITDGFDTNERRDDTQNAHIVASIAHFIDIINSACNR